MYFNICSCCGAHLDPGEKCTCGLIKIEPEPPKKSLGTTVKQFFNHANKKDYRKWAKERQVQWTF